MLILTFTLQAEAQSRDPEAGRASSFHQVPPIILVLKHPGPGAAALYACLPAPSPVAKVFSHFSGLLSLNVPALSFSTAMAPRLTSA